MKQRISLPNLGILTAFASSLCCIMPVIAIIAGTSGLASTFSWLEPARPYFIGSTVLVLGFAWYQKLKPQPIDDCGCHIEQKAPFMQTKTFLSIITVVSALLLSFPSYAHVFFPKVENQTVATPTMTIQKIEFKIEGMTCTGCEHHVTSEINKLKGITEVTVSYEKGNAIVSFDDKQTTINDIIKAINSTGYKAINHKIIS
jgi:copper chaperone CopZ